MFAVRNVSMSKGFVASIIVVLCVLAPSVARMGSVGGALGGYGKLGRSGREGAAAPSRAAAPSVTPIQRPSKRKAPSAFTNYQVPAGTVVAVQLETTVRSATSGVGDQVDATLTESVSRDGVELIPAGSVMHGTVIDALAATPRDLRGRVAIAFFVIEHAVTSSRAAIKTRTIAIDAPPPAEKKPKPVDVQLTAGQSLNVILAEPLLIHIPK